VGVGADLGEHERGALVVGQALEVCEQVLEVLAAFDLGGQPLGRGLHVLEGDVLAAGPQHRQGSVASDRVQPGLEQDVPVVGDEAAIRGDERVLHSVLGLLPIAEHVPAEGQQATVMAVVDRLEGRFVTTADSADQPLVGQRPDEAPGAALDVGHRRRDLPRAVSRVGSPDVLHTSANAPGGRRLGSDGLRRAPHPALTVSVVRRGLAPPTVGVASRVNSPRCPPGSANLMALAPPGASE